VPELSCLLGNDYIPRLHGLGCGNKFCTTFNGLVSCGVDKQSQITVIDETNYLESDPLVISYFIGTRVSRGMMHFFGNY